MTKLIGFTFFMACPYVIGIFIPISIAVQFNLNVVACIAIYSIVWMWLYVAWFDGSKYQDIL